MSLFDCLGTKIKSGLVSAVKGKKARERFKTLADGMIAQGENPTNAYAMAADIVVKEMAQTALDQKHRFLAKVAVVRDLTARVDAAPNLTTIATSMVDDLDFDARAIHHIAMSRITDFLETHAPGVLGKAKLPARLMEFFKALRGEATDDPVAKAMAQAMNDVNEWFRVEMNRYGHNIGKRENWGATQTHDAVSIWRAGRKAWQAVIRPMLNWMDMIDPRTGRNFQSAPDQAYQKQFLDAVYDNIVYGRNSATAKLGRYGIASGNPLERHRVLSFKTTEQWIAYNNKFGASDPFNSLMQHIDHMSRHLALARRFGPDPDMGVDFVGQLVAKKAREGDVGLKKAMIAQGNAAISRNMVRYMSGTVGPTGWHGAVSAKIFSTTRKTLQSALLDRAMIISMPSDLNSARMAADMIGLNKENIMSTYVGLMQDSIKGGGMTRADLKRQLHLADSFANPSVSSARFHQEVPAAAWAEILSNASMQFQGMMAHTDNLKTSIQKAFSAEFASRMGTPWEKLPERLRNDMSARGRITKDDWETFRSSGGEFADAEDVLLLDPLYWRAANRLENRRAADDLAIKMQAYVEKWTELSVPSGSLIAKGVIEPSAYGLAPGGPLYELVKSAGMFKSFVGAFTINQVRMVNAKPTMGGKWAYIAELIGTTTMVGALGMQINDLLFGRDPQDMTNPSFWGRAVLRGGGLGPVGDIIATGASSWGGGYGSYLSGPIPQLATDFGRLTLANAAVLASQIAKGEDIDTGFIKGAATFAKRYMPMGQSPILAGGAAFDRLIADQFQLILDPESANAMAKASQKRKNLTGAGEFWIPGEVAPSRLPNLGTALGQP